MIRKDIARVLEIESESFEHPWKEEEFFAFMRVRNQIGRVMVLDNLVVGYMLYSINKDSFGVVNIAVAKECRRLGVGSSLIWRLVSRLHVNRKNHVSCIVRESNLPALQFFRGLGFMATSVIKSPFDDCDEDAYSMRFSAVDESTKVPFSSRFSINLGE